MKSLLSPEAVIELRNRLAVVSPADSRLWGSMSSHQMICHVADAFELPLSQQAFPPIKISRLPSPVLRWFALSFPMKWPPGVPTLPQLDQGRGNGTQPAEFNADRDRLLLRMEEFAATRIGFSPHPIFGVLSRAEWMRWGYRHSDHHLRQFGR